MALGRALECQFQLEVSIPLHGSKSHKFDLANLERDVVAECKAVGWTSGGNVPSAKIENLRGAVTHLRKIPGPSTSYLIIMKDSHPKKNETLAAYFVRLNKEILGPVNILELPEDGGELVCLHGELKLRRNLVGPASNKSVSVAESVSAGELGDFRRQLFQILDWREGSRNREEGPAKRVSRLRSAKTIPGNVANMMHTLLGFRNAAEYEEYSLTEAEATVVRNAWKAVMEWAQKEGYRPHQ